MADYYVIVSSIDPSDKYVIQKDLCGHLYSKSRNKAEAETAEYRDKLNGGWDSDVLLEKYMVVTTSTYGTTRMMKGFSRFSKRRVTDKKWNTAGK